MEGKKGRFLGQGFCEPEPSVALPCQARCLLMPLSVRRTMRYTVRYTVMYTVLREPPLTCPLSCVQMACGRPTFKATLESLKQLLQKDPGHTKRIRVSEGAGQSGGIVRQGGRGGRGRAGR